MKITLASSTGEIYPLEIGADLPVRDLLAFAERETGIPQGEILLVRNTSPMMDVVRTLGECGVEEGDVIMVSRVEGGVTTDDPAAPTHTTQVSERGRIEGGLLLVSMTPPYMYIVDSLAIVGKFLGINTIAEGLLLVHQKCPYSCLVKSVLHYCISLFIHNCAPGNYWWCPTLVSFITQH